MPLNVLGSEYARLKADPRGRLWRDADRTPAFGAKVGQSGFGVFEGGPAPNPPFIATDGLATCLLLVVHCRYGRGALGHLDGDDRAPAIIHNLRYMIHAIPRPRIIEGIFIASGIDALDRREAIRRAVQAQWPTDVRWPIPNNAVASVAYDKAIYFPTLGKLALWDSDDAFQQIPGGLTHQAVIRTYGFPGTLARPLIYA